MDRVPPFFLLILAVTCVMLSVSRFSLAAPLAGRLTLAGSSTVQPVAEVLGQAFEKLHPGVRVDVHGGGSAVGIAAPQTGLADIGMVSRALRHEETHQLVPTTFAFDGIALIVHTQNVLSGLRRQQVVDLYAGAITNWQVLGGAKAQIVVVNKEAGRGTLELFEAYFDLNGKSVRDAIIIGPNGQAILTVAGNPQAVAYVSIGAAEVAIEQGLPIKTLALDGVAATSRNVKNGTYGLIRPLNFVTAGPARTVAKAFLNFVRSAAAQHLVAAHEFIPVRDTVALH